MEVDKEIKDVNEIKNMEIVDEESKETDKSTSIEADKSTNMEVEESELSKENKATSQLPDTGLGIEIKTEPEEQDVKEPPEIKDSHNDQNHEKNEDSSESSGSAEPDLKEIIRISAGASNKDDGEKMIHLTADEAKQYLLKKIGEYMNTSFNPLFLLRAKAKELEEKGKNQAEEYCKLYKGLQLLQRKHENFLRNVGILPKITMCHENVSADLPMEPVPNPEALLKKELSITKVDNSANKATTVLTTQAKTTTASAAKPSNIECIDLTDEVEPPPPPVITAKNVVYPAMTMLKHPAPLPPRPTTNVKRVPPKPRLKISAEDRGIVLQWDMPPNPKSNPTYDPIQTFEIFGYQEQKNSVINTSLWKKIGSVKSMSLPMACTLTQFVDGNKYHFAIRAVDVNGSCGNYSDAISIVYKQRTPK